MKIPVTLETCWEKGRFLLLILPIALWLLWPSPSPFPEDYSTLIVDCHGQLLRATLNGEGQYCFPSDSLHLPGKYIQAVIEFEDRRFLSHPGVDLLSLAGAFWSNFKSGRQTRGGSTLTMQVARLSRPKARTYFNKLLECLYALKLSRHYSKEEIFRMYAAHVPMGGNVVGIGAASWAYFGKSEETLSWAEAALFAVLPNAPSMINLSKSRPALQNKRNRLLRRLLNRGIINQLTCDLACLESLPDGRRQLPFKAPHFCDLVLKESAGGTVHTTTLDASIQKFAEEVIQYHNPLLMSRGINNLAALIIETETGRVRAYLGSHNWHDTTAAGRVDGVHAYRSTGSLLKPFLAARVLDRGPYTLASKIQDVPTFFGTFVPQNADKQFHGLVSLEETLIRSLNVPSVRLLNRYGLHDFYNFLKDAGLNGLFRGADGYGLTLILGGAEASLWEMGQLYLALANEGRFMPLRFIENTRSDTRERRLFSPGASWLVLQALSKLHRPGSEYYWQTFSHQVPVSWKTGTSYGQKDGWAIGVNRQWTIGVWTGNFNGQGNASISGARTAAPILFSLFNRLTDRDRPMAFDEPAYDLEEVTCCAQSGFPAGPHCPDLIMVKRPLSASAPGVCPFHKRYLLDKKSGQSICSLCWKGVETHWETRFIVPAPVKEILERLGQPVDAIPAHASNCPLFHDQNRFEIVYPLNDLTIFVPRDYSGQYEKVVLSVRHQNPDMKIFWYLNNRFFHESVETHQIAVELKPGEYELTVQDEEGFIRKTAFQVFRKEADRE